MPNQHNIEAPVTLIAFGRSGTSLVSNIFAQHPDCQSVNETGHLIFGVWNAVEISRGVVPPLIENGVRVSDEQRAARVVRESFLTCFPGNQPYWFQKPIAFPEALAAKFSNKPNEGDWSEVAHWYWTVMKTTFPKARFITILRHPCDVILSAQSYWKADAADIWTQLGLMAYLLAHPASPVQYAVHFEELVSEKEKTVTSLLNYLQLPFHYQVFDAFSQLHVPSRESKEIQLNPATRRNEWDTLDPAKADILYIKQIMNLFNKFGHSLQLPAQFMKSDKGLPRQKDTPESPRNFQKEKNALHADYAAKIQKLQQEQQKWQYLAIERQNRIHQLESILQRASSPRPLSFRKETGTDQINILFLSHDSNWGGAQKCLYLLIKGLNHKKYKPIVVLPKAGDLQKSLEQLGVQTELIPLEWIAGNRKYSQYLRFSEGLQQRVSMIIQLIKKEQIDLVFTNTSVILEGALAARQCGVPHIWHILEMFSRDPKLQPLLDLSEFYNLLASLTNKLIVVSKAVKQEIEQFTATDKVEIIYTGIEALPPKDQVLDKNRIIGLEADTPVVTFIGLVSHRKGVLDLVDTAAIVASKFPRVKFVIAGTDDGLLQTMQHKIEEQNLSQVFHFLGFRADIFDILAVSDIFVLPSLSDPLPVTVLEAMIAGKPVVTTRSGGTEEMVVDGETGFLVPIHDPAAMAKAIIQLLEEPDKRHSMGQQGKHRVETLFSLEQYIANFERIFDTAIQEGISIADITGVEAMTSLLKKLKLAAQAKTSNEQNRADIIKRLFGSYQVSSENSFRPVEQVTSPTQTRCRLSICIPTYNGEKYLRDALASILCQSYSDFELIIVDDCSTDATEAIIQSFTDSRITYYRNSSRLGLVGNWNRCLDLATGTYVYIFHQDDVMLPDNIARKVRVLDENPEVGLIYSNVYRLDAEGKIEAKEWFFKTEPDEDNIIAHPHFFEKLISGKNLICCPTVLARRECYEKLGGFDAYLPFVADWEMWLRISLFYPIAYLAEPLIKYRVHDTNETNNFKGLAELEQYYLGKMLVLEKYPEQVPNYHQLRAQIIHQHERQAFDWAFNYYHQRQYTRAREALTFAAALRLVNSIKSSWNNQYVEWLLQNTQTLWKASASPDLLLNTTDQLVPEPPDTQFLLNQLSGEEIAWRVPARKLVKAMGFKVAKQSGLRWLYRFRTLGKKIVGA